MAATSQSPSSGTRGLLEGVVAGTLYGVLLRGYIVLQATLERHWRVNITGQPSDIAQRFRLLRNINISGEVMTVAFLVLGPTVIGYLTVRRMRSQNLSSLAWITAPWLAVICMMVIIAAFAWEGAICVVMALPLTLFFSSLGGIFAGFGNRRDLSSNRLTACVALLPFLLAPAEEMLQSPVETRTVHNRIVIHAAPDVVWRNVERVPAIARTELRQTWTHRLGFPRPVEATLSHEGVGGIRHASFERGVTFVETVTQWEPERRIAFTIRPDHAQIPRGTLDEHVTIGGPFFDVLDGEYQLQPLSDGSTQLDLTSHQRLSTDFNGYAGLWTSAVMSSLQSSILEVIQHRCEHHPMAASISRD